MKAAVERLLRRCGQTVTLTKADGTETQVYAFVRLVSNRSRETFRRTWTGLGELPTGKILYLGPVEPDLSGYTWVVCSGAQYTLRRSVQVYLGGTAVYQWALLSAGGA